VVVNYDDFECPFCSRMHQTLFPELLKEYGDRWNSSTRISRSSKCTPGPCMPPWMPIAWLAQSGDAYWDFADYLHANQEEVNSAKDRDGSSPRSTAWPWIRPQNTIWTRRNCNPASRRRTTTRSKLRSKKARRWAVEATPTLYINGEKMDGVQPIGELRAALRPGPAGGRSPGSGALRERLPQPFRRAGKGSE
jgi:glutaredoxin